MSVNLRTFFGLRENYTLDELRNARNTKLNSLANTSLSDEDKQVYASEIMRLYKKAKSKFTQKHNNFSLTPFYNSNNFFNSILNQIPNINNFGSNFSSQSRSYSERRLSDGSKIIMETIRKNNNGEINEEVKTYKVLTNGTKQEINYNDAIKAIENNI
jgi:hypothetical protein